MLGSIRPRPGAVAIAAAVAALALVAGGAVAGWQVSADVSQQGADTETPRIVIDSSGTAIAVWRRIVNPSVIQVSTRAGAGAGWVVPRTLSAEGGTATGPDIATDGGGQTTVVWRRDNGVRYVIQAVTRAPDGTWGPVQDLSFSDENAYEPNVAASAGGTTVVVWRRYDSGIAKFVVQAAIRLPGGPWSPPQTISDTSADAQFPRVAVDALGNAVVVWRRDPGANCGVGRCTIQSVFRTAGGSWSSPVTISADPTLNSRRPAVAMSANGDAVAVWTLTNEEGVSVIQAAARPIASGAWQAPQTLSTPGQEASRPKVVVDASGEATAAWIRFDGSHDVAQVASRRGSWGPPQNLSDPAQNAGVVELAGNAEGAVVATWRRSDGANTIIQAAIKPAGATLWQDLSDLSVPGRSADEPAVAIAANGVAAAAWIRNDGANNITQGAIRTTSGPSLVAIRVPGVVRLNDSVTMSVQTAPGPFPLAGLPQWTFGDGGTASGYDVRHTFTRAGTFTVTVTQSDTQGSPVVAQRIVQVIGSTQRLVRIAKLNVSPRILVRVSCPADRPATCARRKPARVTFTANRAANLTMTLRKAGQKRVAAATTVRIRKGSNSFLLRDRVGGRKLTPGRYTVTMAARRPVRLSGSTRFTVTVR